MLTRLYIDNFRCFVNFEYRPARRQLILGRNGSGKSSLVDALRFLREFAAEGEKLDGRCVFELRTRWMSKPLQTFELDAELDGDQYVYRLLLEPCGEPSKARVASESLHMNDRPLFKFEAGQMNLYDDRLEHGLTYPLDWNRSALAITVPSNGNQTIERFQNWLGELYCFRINPLLMDSKAGAGITYPDLDLSDFAAWYKHLAQAHPENKRAFLEDLRGALDGFTKLEFETVARSESFLVAEFEGRCGAGVTYLFVGLSDGQRCLICLNAILHFLVATGNTVILDEPDNFVSLREIQPWLMAATDIVEDGQGQLLLISHHPEIINQWAPGNGVQFVRDGGGPVRVVEFRGDPDSSLSSAEVVARGWDLE